MHNVKRSARQLVAIVLMLSLLMAACAAQTTYDGSAQNIIEPDAVKQAMASGAVVLDARGAEAYAKGHLEGAHCMPVSKVTAEADVKGLVASKEKVAAALSELGIESDDLVLIYDDKGGVFSGRIWWVLTYYGHDNVKIINGGASGLERAALPMSATTPEVNASQYTVGDADQSMCASLEEVKQIAEGQSSVKLIDVRSAAEYAEGYIPTAINIPHTENLYSDGTFKSKRVIELNYADKGLSKDDNIVLYCKTSFRAAQTAALLNEAGYQNVRIYDGAWLEWQNQDVVPTVEPEEEVKPTSQDGS